LPSARATSQAPTEIALTPAEIESLDHAIPDRSPKAGPRSLATYLTKIARLGGDLARAHYPPPSHTLIWRGGLYLAGILLSVEFTHGR